MAPKFSSNYRRRELVPSATYERATTYRSNVAIVTRVITVFRIFTIAAVFIRWSVPQLIMHSTIARTSLATGRGWSNYSTDQ